VVGNGGDASVPDLCEVERLGFTPENLARQPGQSSSFGGLSAGAREVGDDEGKNYGDNPTGDRRRDAGALRYVFDSRGAEALLHLFGAHGFVLSWSDPGLNLVGEAVLLQLTKNAVHPTLILLHHLA